MKIKQNLCFKNKQNKKIEKNEKIEVLAAIPPLKITSFEAIEHFGLYGGEKKTDTEMPVLDEITRQNFKTAGVKKQQKLLLQYIKERSENGVWKKEGNRIIGDFFGVGRDLVQNRFNQLIELGYLVEMIEMNRFYKINKEWSV